MLHMAIKMPVAYACMRALDLPPPAFGAVRGLVLHVMPLGFTTAGDIAFSNLSLLYITVTYYTIFKSSVPLWILLFSVCLGLQHCRMELLLVLLCIATGITLASVDIGSSNDDLATADALEEETVLAVLKNFTDGGGGDESSGSAQQLLRRLFDEGSADGEEDEGARALTGGLLVLAACACSGFRWACTQFLLAPKVRTGRGDGASMLSDSEAEEEMQPAEAELQWGCASAGSDGSESGGCEASGLKGAADPLEGGHDSDKGRTRASRVAELGPTHPVTLLFYISPFGVVVLAPLAMYVEADHLKTYLFERSMQQALQVLVLAGIGGLVSFVLLLLELRIVRLSSGLSLSIAGIFKEVLTVACSAIFLHDKLTLYNIGGFVVCLLGIGMYNRMQWNRDAADAARGEGGGAPSGSMCRYARAEGTEVPQPLDCKGNILLMVSPLRE
eukprot:CAMPEP_0183359984 /NCGR_PEP_ID=MMETSP0164_2-20130417/53922_1 /TAXON_ID=221442 /ORGANISM="Coccolithus pelagicus ssp braarudi, Strain PLY182g" /LENGTH=444 /DNA_ID=CAMNT_0025534227 /DNA_START=332 /DNA_END=1666 /DNA_ORIENTATION=+